MAVTSAVLGALYASNSIGWNRRRWRMKFVVEFLQYLISVLHKSQTADCLSGLAVNSFQQILVFPLEDIGLMNISQMNRMTSDN